MLVRRFALPLTLGLAFVAAPLAAHAQEEPGAALVNSEAEARGDFSAWLGVLAEEVARAPEDPAAMAALWKIRNIMGSANDPTVVEKTLDPVLDGGLRDGETEEVLRDLLARRARMRGEFDRGREYEGDAGYVRRFAVIGPFDPASDALLWKRYPPEARAIDFSESMKGTSGPVRWLELPQLGDNVWVSPDDQIRQGGRGVVYAVAHVRTSGSGPVALKVWCSGSFRIWVNGRDALVADRTRDRTPELVWGDAHLESGWNRVLVKVIGSASFALKLVDPATGHPLRGVEVGSPLETEVFSGTPAPAEPRSYRTPAERIEDEVALGEPSPVRLAVAAMLADWNGLDWEALGYWEQAARAVPDGRSALSANVRAAYGRALASFSEYPSVHRKLLARAQFDQALEHFEGHNSAVLRIAGYEDEDDRPDKAVEMLREYAAKTPTETALMALARIAKGRKWEKEAIDAATTALAVAPNSRDALDFLNGYDSRYGDQDAVLARLRRRLEIDASDSGAASDLIASLRSRGKDAEALAELEKLADRWPGSLGWRSQRAEILNQLGRHEESLAVWRELAGLVPDEPRYPREIGEILETTGDRAAAAEAYRSSLEERPFQPNLWRALARIDGAEFDFAQGFEPDVADLMDALPSTEELKTKYPKAVALTVLDHAVVKSAADGSAINYVNMLYKLLDEKGVEKYGDVARSGETLEIAAYLPDGTRLLPTGLGGRSYNMEGLVPGAFVHHRFVNFRGPGKDGKFDPGGFSFQDRDLRRNPNPVLRSRWVILTAKDVKLTPDQVHHFDEGPTVEEFEGLTATIWEKLDMPRITAERNMPPADEIIPSVTYTEPETFEDANWTYLGNRSSNWPTPVLTDALAGILEDGMSDVEKLRAIHAFVNKEITGDSGSSRKPSGILMEKAGNRTTLFEGLVRTAGIPYRIARAMPWNGVGRDLSRPDPTAFTRTILWLEPRGSDPIPFFGGARLAPFGLVPAAYRGSAVFIASEAGGRILQLAHGGLDVRDTADFKIGLGAGHDQVTVEGLLVYRSSPNYRGKKTVADFTEDRQKKVCEGQIGQYFAGPTLTDYSFPDMDVAGKPLTIEVKGTMSTYLSKQGDVFVASLGLPECGATGRFIGRTERHYDLILSPRDDNHDRVEIDLGEHFEVTRLPDDHLAVHDVGTYSLTFRQTARRVVIEREWHFRPARYTPDEYPGFIEWCKAIDDAEKAKIEFRKFD